MNENNRKVKNIIGKCGADSLMPFALIFGFYVILHGHLSPGGGFQGGIVVCSAVVLLYLGYGYKVLMQSLSFNLLHKTEGFASILYVAFAMIGVVCLGNFCMNALYNAGNIGDLWSTGTIFLMNSAVGLKVLTGVSVLIMLMLGIIAANDGEEE